MSPQQFRKVSDIFQHAVDLPAEEREAYLAEACSGDEALRREVDDLLRSDAESAGRLDVAVIEAARSYRNSPPEVRNISLVGEKVGPYRIVREIGHGGMGAVYEAVRDDEAYVQSVAIKFIAHGVAAPDALARFRLERQVLAQLHHPNIATLLDGGTSADGRPYIVMEYIEGQPLLEYCRQRDLSVDARIELFCDVCSAVHHAHQMLVLHRDIKPANVLVTAEGTPKLLDFGIAKLLVKGSSTDGAPTTITAMRRLTPQYASPEQIRAEQLTTASDVYSLGVLLYELLTYRSPYQTTGYSVAEIERAVCEQEPTKMSRIVGNNPRLRRELSGDLETIVAMALRKEARRRYSSAQELADDLGRYLKGLPVSAREDTIFYLAGKLVRRNKLATAAFALLILSVITGWTMTIREARRTEARFEEVRRLANVMIREIPHDIRELPGSVPVRAKLVRTALQYLNNLSADSGDDLGFQYDLAQAYDRVGDAQGDPEGPSLGEYSEALASYKQAIVLMERVVASHTESGAFNTLAWLHLKSGDLLWRMGKTPLALDSYRAGLKVAAQMRTEANDPRGYNVGREGYQRVARAQLASRNLDPALDSAQSAIDAAEAYATKQPGNRASQSIATAKLIYGDVLGVTGRLEQSRRAYEEAVSRLQKVVADAPNFWPAVEDLADAYRRIGDLLGAPVYFNYGDAAAAEIYLNNALELEQRIAAHDPASALAKSRLSIAYRRLASVIRVQRPAAAIELYKRAIEIGEGLLKSEPGDFNYQRETAKHRVVYAQALSQVKDFSTALAQMDNGMRVLKRLTEELPNRTVIHEDWFHALATLGEIRLRQHHSEQAVAQYEEALRVARGLVQRDGRNLYATRCVAVALRGLGDAHAAAKRRDIAADHYREALAIWSQWDSENIAVPFSTAQKSEVSKLLAAVRRAS